MSDTHIVGTPGGIVIGRSCRPLGWDDVSRGLYHQMVWTPGHLRGVASEVVVRDAEPIVSEPASAASDVPLSTEKPDDEPSLQREASRPYPMPAQSHGPFFDERIRQFRAFLEQMGRTKGCDGCYGGNSDIDAYCRRG